VPAAVAFSHVTKRYPEVGDALADATFALESGEFAYLTGHSGAGKSTIIRLIAALERPSAGAVVINGQNVGSLSARAVPFLRRQIGLVLQDAMLLFDRDVYANVLLPLAIVGVNSREAARRVRAALEKVGLAGRARALPVALSGGEQQRVAIARAIVHRPSLILADEPTANLDPAAADTVLALFRAFHAVGVTVLVATHDAALIGRHPAREIRLDHGRLVS
jgi:cell division transport system ATP-binding protein